MKYADKREVDKRKVVGDVRPDEDPRREDGFTLIGTYLRDRDLYRHAIVIRPDYALIAGLDDCSLNHTPVSVQEHFLLDQETVPKVKLVEKVHGIPLDLQSLGLLNAGKEPRGLFIQRRELLDELISRGKLQPSVQRHGPKGYPPRDYTVVRLQGCNVYVLLVEQPVRIKNSYVWVPSHND